MNPQNTNELLEYYLQKITYNESKVQSLQKRINWVATVRLSIVIAILVIGYFLYPKWEIIALLGVAGIIAFLFLVKHHNKLFLERNFAEEHVSLFREEMQRLERVFTGLDAGKEFIDGEHFYTSDLDIFGEGSMYQYISRAKTISGRENLASWFKDLAPNQEILDRQGAVDELNKSADWRQAFHARSRMVIEKTGEYQKLTSWLQEPRLLPENKLLQISLTVLPFVAIILWVLSFFLLPVRVALGFSTLLIIIVGAFTKQINALHGKSDEKAKLLHKYAEMIQAIENQEWKSQKMQGIKAALKGKSSNASKSLFQLTKLVEALDSRVNILGMLVTNGLYMRDLRNALGIENWKENNKDLLPGWFAALAEAEALASIATYAFNNPAFSFPQLAESEFIVEAENLAHPLLKAETRIGNNLQIDGWSQIMLITGSNMAGKSTFLRAVGVNYVLASMGAPVCASNFRFTPIPLFTSMRIGDSIKDSESTFYAELKRIKTIIVHLQAGKPLFILLDEILRGTNSADKLTGSKALLKQLVLLKGTGILATHDLALAKLEEEYPQNIHNYHFDVDIIGDKFDFSYKLKRGVCKTLNATLLMQKMGIDMQ